MRNLGCLALAAAMLLACSRARADEQKELRGLIEKGLAALGGAEKVAKYPAATWKGSGTYHVGRATPFSVTGARQGAGQLALTVESRSKDFNYKRSLVVNGDKGWLKVNTALEDLSKAGLAEEKERMYANWLSTLAPILNEKDIILSAAPPAKAAGRDVAGVKVRSKGHRDVVLYFDKKSGELVRRDTTLLDFLGDGKEVKQEVMFSDYRPTAVGVKQAMKVRVIWDGRLISEAELAEVRPQEKLPESAFGRP